MPTAVTFDKIPWELRRFLSDSGGVVTRLPKAALHPRVHVRLTLWKMMTVVAILAVALSVVDQLRRRRESFRLRAEEYRHRVSVAIMDEQEARVKNRFNHNPRTTASYYQLVEHYEALQVKYEQAAARPWSFLMPDPPEPVWPQGVPRVRVDHQ